MIEKTDFCNLSENFTREIRYILIYDATALSFNENLRGDYPDPNDYICKIPVYTQSTYKRKVQLKKQDKNDCFNIDIRIPFYDLDFENREKLYRLDMNRKYLIVTVSNKEMMVLGNHRERLSVSVLDNIVDNGSGKDHFLVHITGKTIIRPYLRRVTPMFRVLLFDYPFA